MLPQQPNHVTAATDTHATIEELFEALFSMRSLQRLYMENQLELIKTHKSFGKNKNMVMDPDGTQNEDWLCWRGPAAI
jgi:hypothetical protein